MKRGEYLTAWERRHRLRAELIFWRRLTASLGVLMLVAFVAGRGMVGAVVGVCAFAAACETAAVRARLERISRV